jgi:acyl dehydratase
MSQATFPGKELFVLDQKINVTSAIELAAFVGADFRPGDWRSITLEEVSRFVDLTGDKNWIHRDTDRVKRQLEGQRPIVPGQLLLSLIPALLQDVYTVTNAEQSREAALRAVRFRRAVYPGDRFRLRGRLTRVSKRPQFVIVEAECNLELGSGELALTSRRTDVFFSK